MMNRILCISAAALLALMPFSHAESALSGEQIHHIEQRLCELGYHSEDCNSQLDAETLDAVLSFQLANGLPPTGTLTAETQAQIDAGTAVSCRDYLANLSAVAERSAAGAPGDSGEHVLALQRALKSLGYYFDEPDGVYSASTILAVRRFQLANGLELTGDADASVMLRLQGGRAEIWQSFLMGSVCAAGQSGSAVRLLQCTLRDMGYFTGAATGVYGSETRQAVAAFQSQAGLAITGDADQDTCVLLYEQAAQSEDTGAVLSVGSDGERVTLAQTLLAECGYFDHNITGYFGPTTETAVRLFQMGNGLKPTGLVTEGTIALLQSNYARKLDDVREGMVAELKPLDDAACAGIGQAALRMRGHPFAADDEDLYAGFAFVQYTMVGCGMPVTSAEEALEYIQDPVDNIAGLKFGDVITYRLEGDEAVHFAIVGEDGAMLYSTQRSPWVLETSLSAVQVTEMNRWAVRA